MICCSSPCHEARRGFGFGPVERRYFTERDKGFALAPFDVNTGTDPTTAPR
jgi:hypothetical protein